MTTTIKSDNAENIINFLQTSPLNRYLNINEVGIGMWYVLHSAAANSRAGDRNCIYIQLLALYEIILSCGNCRGHFIEMKQTHDINEYINLERGFSIHAWILHNSVSARLTKEGKYHKLIDCGHVGKWFSELRDLINRPSQ